jgi:uncharacterized protein (TIGR02271 family)
MQTRSDIREGMIVRASDGEKLGKVYALQADSFLIEKGIFFPKEYVARFEDVVDIRDGDIYLNRTKADLQEMGTARGERWGYADENLGTAETRVGISEEVRVPLVEEELTAEKRMKETGRVRVTKEVVTEEKHITVPVTREEVRVERVPASGAARVDDATFQKQSVTIPVREEEVEITKRPVVREEVRVSKTAHQEQRTASATVRRETADVDEDKNLRRDRLVDDDDLKKT